MTISIERLGRLIIGFEYMRESVASDAYEDNLGALQELWVILKIRDDRQRQKRARRLFLPKYNEMKPARKKGARPDASWS